ncbi:MAG: DNA-directed RNA polymerase subunit alpha [Oscillospiraceae bacterium]|jgi:DNA-directed RNA polymerase subunit alpha|nr:DNA-directed RNA polymerase subunit alpha [Oscillospiraceae bacterium]
MAKIEKPRMRIIESEKNSNYAEFVLEPLERGFGSTLGNSMRRVLLSILPGAAASSVRIAGVMHEFSVIPGVKEDVTEIILNIKSLILRLNNCEVRDLVLDVEGPIKATASMIKTTSEVTIFNTDLLIATLEEGAHLSMEITVNKGVGYLSSEQNRAMHSPIIGAIAVDSLFSPVLKANYSVENTRVGQTTDYDRLTLQVKTNGVISAREAVSKAGKELINYFNVFTSLVDEEPELEEVEVEQPSCESPKVVSDGDIENLNLSARSYNSLKRAEINRIEELMVMSSEEIYQIRNLGKKSYEELVGKLTSLGWNL